MEVEVLVTKDVVDTTNGRPVLVLLNPRERVGGVVTRVRAIPCRGGADLSRVRGVLQGVVVTGPDPGLDLVDLLADLDQGVAEAVELLLGLGFGGLDHEGAGNGEGHGGGMEAIVD